MPVDREELQKKIEEIVMGALRNIDNCTTCIEELRNMSPDILVDIDKKPISRKYSKILAYVDKHVEFRNRTYHGRKKFYPCEYDVPVYIVHNLSTRKLRIFMMPLHICVLYDTVPRDLPVEITANFI
jgi:hypothetical protein